MSIGARSRPGAGSPRFSKPSVSSLNHEPKHCTGVLGRNFPGCLARLTHVNETHSFLFRKTFEAMTDSFDVNAYWLNRGKTYIQEERLALDYHRRQERFLFDLLRQARLPFSRILEVGCGFGRVTKLLTQNFPGAQIMAVDLSPDQLLNARNYCAGCENITFQAYDFYSDEALPGEDYDCALAIEVFLHHPERVLRAVLGRLLAVSRSVVSIDWSEHWPWKTPAHVWVHD